MPSIAQAGATGRLAGRTALLLVENVSVPLDRRVWPEAGALARAGMEVTVISPRGEGRDLEPFERLEGVEIHRFPPSPATGGAATYAREYGKAFVGVRRLLKRLHRQGRRFDVVHAANPPDFLLLAARGLKRDGTRFVFDQHDLVPELYRSRFGRRRDPVYRLFQRLERQSYALADLVISTNESYRRIAIERGGKRPEDVTVVRNGPSLDRFNPTEPDASLKQGKQHLIAYVGVMGPQDGVEGAIRALALLAGRRDDWRAVFVGNGDVYDDVRSLAGELGVADSIEFTGYLEEPDVVRVLSSADVCLSPEPRDPLNDVSTLIKVAEYMAMSRPVVAFDLQETRFSAQEAALYATPNESESFAACIEKLLDDPGLRDRMGAVGRARVEEALSWESSERVLIGAYERLID